MLFRVAPDRDAFLENLRTRGILMERYPHGQIRVATHYGIEAADIETTIAAVRAALAETSRRSDATSGARA